VSRVPSAVALALVGALGASAQETTAPPDLTTVEAAREGARRAVDWLVRTQRPDGTWATSSCDSLFDDNFAVETYYAYQMGAHGVAVLALLAAPETPEVRAALDKAVRWICTSRMPQRGNDWDNDAVWSVLYGTVATTSAARDPRFDNDEWRGIVHQRGREFVRFLEANQVPEGGFGYYDEGSATRRPKWATSFSTSCVLPALGAAMELGWSRDPELLQRAADYVRRCRLPTGAFGYDWQPIPRGLTGESINAVKGSLGRIQVSHWALRLAGDPYVTDERLRWGLDQFFEHHKFLLVARMRPIPHEAFYANASYFYFFGHYYAALCIEMLPASEREPLRERFRPLILQFQRKGGSFSDSLETGYMEVSSTAYAALSLLAGLGGT